MSIQKYSNGAKNLYENVRENLRGSNKLIGSMILSGLFVGTTILLGSLEKTYSQHQINYIQNSIGDTASADTAKVKKTLVDKF